MVDSNHIPSGKVVNMDEAQGNSGIPMCNSDFIEEARKFKRSTVEFSNVNSESKVEKKGGVTMSVTPTKKLKMKPSKKRFSRKMSKKKIPVTGRTVTVTELFKTGLLEGLPVFYNGGKKGILLRGTIRGTGILCSCDLCMGTRVVLATQFERHACKIKRRASDYICLENGKSLRDVIKECMRNPSKTLEETIQNVIGTVPLKKSLTCQDCKNKSFLEPLCEACVTSFKSEATPALPTSTENGLLEFESSATKRYLEQWEKKATDEYPEMQHEISVVPPAIASELNHTRFDAKQSKTKSYPDVPSGFPPCIVNREDYTLSDVSPATPLEKEAISSVETNCPDFVYLDHRLGKLERLVAYLRNH